MDSHFIVAFSDELVKTDITLIDKVMKETVVTLLYFINENLLSQLHKCYNTFIDYSVSSQNRE